MTEHVKYGGKEISFELQFADRKTLGISVNPEKEVKVKAPAGTSMYKIKEKVIKRASWILKQQRYFETFLPKMPEKRFVSGETHLYMGRHYKLKVIQGKKNEVRYKGREIVVTTRNKSDAGQLMQEWYRQRAKIKFAEIAEPIITRFKKYGVEPQNIYVQKMTTRWGSCTEAGRIILNPELIKAPRGSIEFVITHELCHLVHRNHTRKFIQLQTKEMPDWEKWKLRLEKLLA